MDTKYARPDWISEKYFSFPRSPRIICFLDRDDTLIRDLGLKTNLKFPRLKRDCVNEIGKVSKVLRKQVIFIVVTNQSRIAKGYSTLTNLRFFHFIFVCLLAIRGVRINRILSCPHMSDDECACRKPNVGPIISLLDEINGHALPKYFLGNSKSDAETGHRISAITALLDLERSKSGKFANIVLPGKEKSASMEVSAIILQSLRNGECDDN